MISLSQISFNKVNDTTNEDQKEGIWEWCKDHVENFGSIPYEYFHYSDSEESKVDDITIDYDHMLSALTDEQLDQLNGMIESYSHE